MFPPKGFLDWLNKMIWMRKQTTSCHWKGCRTVRKWMKCIWQPKLGLLSSGSGVCWLAVFRLKWMVLYGNVAGLSQFSFTETQLQIAYTAGQILGFTSVVMVQSSGLRLFVLRAAGPSASRWFWRSYQLLTWIFSLSLISTLYLVQRGGIFRHHVYVFTCTGSFTTTLRVTLYLGSEEGGSYKRCIPSCNTMFRVVHHVTKWRNSIRLLFCRKCPTYVSRLWQTFSPASSATLSTTCAASSSVARGSGVMTAGTLRPTHRGRFIQAL